MDGERIAKLYAELGYPGAAKFQSALRKEGINVSLGNLRDLVKTLGNVGRRVDEHGKLDRWHFAEKPFSLRATGRFMEAFISTAMLGGLDFSWRLRYAHILEARFNTNLGIVPAVPVSYVELPTWQQAPPRGAPGPTAAAKATAERAVSVLSQMPLASMTSILDSSTSGLSAKEEKYTRFMQEVAASSAGSSRAAPAEEASCARQGPKSRLPTSQRRARRRVRCRRRSRRTGCPDTSTGRLGYP